MARRLPTTLIFYAYFLGVAIWLGQSVIIYGRYLVWQAWLPGISWFLGGIIGYWLLSLDRLVDIYLTHPNTQLAHYIRYYIQKGQCRWAWVTLSQRKNEQLRLTLRSVVFQLIWVGLTLFALTSTVSWLGKGVVMGLGLHLLLDEWGDYRHDPLFLRQWLFWQIKREVSLNEQKTYLWFMTGAVAIFTLLALR